ncbi:Basement membrane-specific heparan sulfate proteoglycan core protein [Schistosoma japonicum]|nr:Basement membrane-specific heparan sulfate proteoglycan core protein [Schistosoma japonicum]
MFAIIILYFGLLNPVQSLLAKQKHEEKDWSMIMEVEVEDPIYNSSYDETDKKNIVNNKVNEPFQRKKNETITGIFTTQHSMPDATKCGSFLCFNHGRCYVDSNTSSAKCLCLLGYSGDLCDKVNDGHQFPYIQQGGYLKFNFKSSAPYIAANQSLTNYNHQMSINNTYTYRVDFEIQPNISDGSYLLVSHVSNDENFKFSLSIENGYVVYRSLRISRANYEPLSKEEIQEVKHFSFLNTEQWYYISFGEMIDGKSFLITPWSNTIHNEKYLKNVNGMELSYISFGGNPDLTKSEGPIHFLGYDFEKSYSGCIQNIRINEVYMDPRRKPFVGDAVYGYGITNCGIGLCEKKQCKNNAACLQTSGSTVICQCPLGTYGQLCEKRGELIIPSYSGHSYTEYIGLSGTSSSFTTLELQFRPIKPDGLILYEGYSHDSRGDFLAIILVNGYVVVAFDLGSGSAFLKSEDQMKLNEWHLIRFWRIGRVGYLQVDLNEHIMTNYSFGLQVQLTLTYFLFLGGHPNLNIVSTHIKEYIGFPNNLSIGFQGCISKIETNGILIDPIKNAIGGANVYNCAGQECGFSNPVCLNNGKCVQYSNGYKCICPVGFHGKNCKEKINWQGKQLAMFGGNSFVKFTTGSLNYRSNSRYYHISLEFQLSNKGFKNKLTPFKNFSPANNSSFDLLKQYLIYAVFQSVHKTQTVLVQLFPRRKLKLSLENSETEKHELSLSNLTNQSLNYNELWEVSRNQLNRRLPIQKYDISEELEIGQHWHKLLLTKSSTSITLFINQSHVARIYLKENEMKPVELFIGGIPEALHARRRYLELMSSEYSSLNKENIYDFSKNFNGCIKKLEINGHPASYGDVTDGQDIAQCT